MFRLRIDEVWRVVGVEDGIRVRVVLEMAEWVRTRHRTRFEARGDRGGRVLVAGNARPGVAEQAGRSWALLRGRHLRDWLKECAGMRVKRIGVGKAADPNSQGRQAGQHGKGDGAPGEE